MYKPNLKALRTFQAAATHLNFRLAAEELHITRGAVAQQIRKLEDDLGVTLFYRLPRGLALTQRGKEYFLSIQDSFQANRQRNSKLYCFQSVRHT